MNRTVFMFVLCASILQAKTVRVFFVGNSVTDGINYTALDQICESRGDTHTWGRCMTPGAPLGYLWNNGCGFTEAPFGDFNSALTGYTWDFLSLQPYDWTIDEDVDACKNYINLAKRRSPGLKALIFMRVPRKGEDTHILTGEDWNELWESPHTGGWNINCESRDFYEQLCTRLRSQVSGIAGVYIAPAGEVMYELNKKMLAGQVQGFSSILDIYSDGVHLNGNGSYINGCTYYAVMYGESPQGLPYAPYGVTDASYAALVQTVAWQVVTSYQYSGVTGTGAYAPPVERDRMFDAIMKGQAEGRCFTTTGRVFDNRSANRNRVTGAVIVSSDSKPGVLISP